MKTTLKITLLIALSLFAFAPGSNNPKITSSELMEHIKFLSSDELAGRFPGSEGDTRTQDYLIDELESYKITSAGDDGYRQRFSYAADIKLGSGNKLTLSDGSQPKVEADFLPVYLSSNGSVSAPVVFIGYGINAGDLNYNDYAGIDLTGKIAMMLMYSPGYNNPHDNPFSKYERLRSKCAAAKEQGAIGLIIVKGPETGEDELIKLRMYGHGENIGIPTVSVKRSALEGMFTAEGKNLLDVQKGIDSSKTPASFDFKGTTSYTTDVIPIEAKTSNIIAMIEGKDPVLKSEVIVIGAHMDHLGDGMKYGSLFDKHEPEIHNGADDNASGTAGVLELAQYFASKKKDLKRSVMFMWFSGEEAGLIGSAYFVKSELFKKYNIVSMINLDMIGRLTDNKLTIGGTGTSSIWNGLLDSLNKTYNFAAAYTKDGFGPSDHSSFYGKNIPVLFFFTGLHKQYHRPDDDWQLINAEGETKILNMVVGVVNYVDDMPSKPDYVKVKEDKQTTSNMGFRVTLGVIPDYSSTKEGLEITGVKAGGVAEKAGLQGGDVIIKLGQYEIKNIYDYTDALGRFKPGEEADVVLKRGTEELTLKVVFAK